MMWRGGEGRGGEGRGGEGRRGEGRGGHSRLQLEVLSGELVQKLQIFISAHVVISRPEGQTSYVSI